MVINSIQFFRLDPIICGSALAGPAGEYTGASNKRGPHEGPFPVESMMGDGDGDVAGCQALLALGTTTTTTTGYIPSAL